MWNNNSSEIKKHKSQSLKYKVYFRNKGKSIYIDFAFIEEEIIKTLLDLGIDLTKYDEFNFKINAAFKIKNFMNDNCDFIYFLNDIFQLVIYLKSLEIMFNVYSMVWKKQLKGSI